MSYYWVGDRPLSALVLVPTRAGADGAQTAINLDDWTAAEGALVRPSGGTTPLDVALADGALEVDLHGGGDAGPFAEAGLYLLRLTLVRAEQLDEGGATVQPAARERLDAVPLVVHADDGWHTLPSARDEWRDAGRITDRRLYVLLDIARTQVTDYAPQLPDGALPPLAYREAQLMQARNLWNASRVDPSGGEGADSFAVTPFPLDWTIKQLLRPKRARPVVA
jgi:hypothetical protein